MATETRAPEGVQPKTFLEQTIVGFDGLLPSDKSIRAFRTDAHTIILSTYYGIPLPPSVSGLKVMIVESHSADLVKAMAGTSEFAFTQVTVHPKSELPDRRVILSTQKPSSLELLGSHFKVRPYAHRYGSNHFNDSSLIVVDDSEAAILLNEIRNQVAAAEELPLTS